ncbi:MAG: VWA domain-containing protein [Acidobacteria bacterium]|nr:VWA domain-containing protein [Acidobacteriota bacterium]MCL5286968.1 VWA domain-containing protein [Acidobacteriota bacterium]
MRATFFRFILFGLLTAVLAFPPAPALVSAQQQQQAPPKQPPPDQKREKPEGEFALAVEVPLVNVDVVVTDNNGGFLSGLRRENFRVLEDGVPQTITNFAPTDAPITMVMLIEFSKLGRGIFAYYATAMAHDFLRQLKPEDWIALVSYDLKTRIEVDFTRDKREIERSLMSMYFPGFSEACIFDAVLETLDRLKDVKGKKSILILGTGLDTFSKHSLDEVLKRLRETDVTIFTVVAGRAYIEYLDARGAFNGTWGFVDRMNLLQAENQMRSFAYMTGGRSWAPRFEGEWSGIFYDVAASLRNQYSIGYSPSNRTRDGKLRKIKVQLVDAKGAPLVVQDQKGKKVKYVIYAREGYLAPKPGISD